MFVELSDLQNPIDSMSKVDANKIWRKNAGQSGTRSQSLEPSA